MLSKFLKQNRESDEKTATPPISERGMLYSLLGGDPPPPPMLTTNYWREGQQA